MYALLGGVVAEFVGGVVDGVALAIAGGVDVSGGVDGDGGGWYEEKGRGGWLV